MSGSSATLSTPIPTPERPRLLPTVPRETRAARPRRRAWWVFPLAMLLWAGTGAALAQTEAQEDDPPAEAAAAKEPDGGQDEDRMGDVRVDERIIVTAQKREELLQEVPISLTAFTAETIAEQLMVDIQDISVRTPGMHYGNFPDQKLSPLSLRGIVGSSGSAGADPAVSQYVDEVYVGQGAGAFLDLFDLERAEVLRGPQGIFFGRNSIGGAVSYTTRRPANEPEALLEANYGSESYYRVGALVSGPLAEERLAGKISFVANDRDGTYRNLWLDRDVNSVGSWSARGQLLWTPAPTTEVTFTAERHEVDQESLFFETLSYNEDALFVQVLDAVGMPRNRDPFDREGYGDVEQTETLDLAGYSLHMNTSKGNLQLTSVTSYRDHEYDSLRDTDASGLQWLYDGDPEEVDRFSQEIRASWWTPRVTYLVGAYYFDQTSNNESFIDLGEDITALLLGQPLRIRSGSNAELSTRSLAGFANLTIALGDRADASLGVRYTVDDKEIDYTQDDPLGLFGGDTALAADDDWSAATPAFNLRYRFTDDIRGYVNVGRGFKSGGFNDALGSADGIAFGPEFLWNYEVGLKSVLLEGRVVANLAAFYMDWEDIQIVVDNTSTPVFDPIIANAGAAHSTGLEGELTASPASRWLLGLNFALLEAEYDGGTQPDGTPLDKIPYTPDYTANLRVEYRHPWGDREWFVAGEAMNRGEVFLTQDNQADGRVGAHTLVDLRLGLAAGDAGWRVTLWGKNVTDETVTERLFDLYDLGIVGQKFIALNEPATWGVTLGWSF